MKLPLETAITAVELYEPDPAVSYTIEQAAQLARLPRRRIARYCQYGLVSTIRDPESGGWLFNDEGVRRLRQLEALRALCGFNLRALRLVMDLMTEVERLRAALEEARDLVRTGLKPDVCNYTDEEWLQHKLFRVAGIVNAALNGGTP